MENKENIPRTTVQKTEYVVAGKDGRDSTTAPQRKAHMDVLEFLLLLSNSFKISCRSIVS